MQRCQHVKVKQVVQRPQTAATRTQQPGQAIKHATGVERRPVRVEQEQHCPGENPHCRNQGNWPEHCTDADSGHAHKR